MNNIYLVGFMGTGKTAAGKELAKIKEWQFVDLDELIELKEKRTIPDIFAKSGEPYFRRIEKRVLQEVAKEEKFVVACGGGIVIDKDNIKVMKDTGIIICLFATPEVILKRASGYTHRPLLNVSDPEKQIELLLKLRAQYYAQADKTIDTSKLSVEKVVEKIIGVTKFRRRRTFAVGESAYGMTPTAGTTTQRHQWSPATQRPSDPVSCCRSQVASKKAKKNKYK